jgi:hypothetical protein
VKSVIIARLLVWSAPAVCAISRGETMVWTVDTWVSSLLVEAETSTPALTGAISS